MAGQNVSLRSVEMCRGICQRYFAKKPERGGRYTAGQKRCQMCAIWIQWDGIRCPCCSYRLRLRPRSLKYKAIYRDKMKNTLTPKISKCIVCKKDFALIYFNQKICGLKCKKIRQKEQYDIWRKSEKGEAAQKRRRKSKK